MRSLSLSLNGVLRWYDFFGIVQAGIGVDSIAVLYRGRRAQVSIPFKQAAADSAALAHARTRAGWLFSRVVDFHDCDVNLVSVRVRAEGWAEARSPIAIMARLRELK